jgi:hypothetical protein
METAYNFDGYRRINERKNYNKDVSFSTESMIFPATIKNLSMGGALVGTMSIPQIKKGAKIIITIPFANKPGCMKRKAIVMWVENDQFGIQFI